MNVEHTPSIIALPQVVSDGGAWLNNVSDEHLTQAVWELELHQSFMTLVLLWDKDITHAVLSQKAQQQ